MLFETYGAKPINPAGRTPAQRSRNFGNKRPPLTKVGSRNAATRPSVFNNFGKPMPLRKGVSYPMQARVIGTEGKGYPGTRDVSPGWFPNKTPQTGGPGIDNPGKTPGGDWDKSPDCQCGSCGTSAKGCTILSNFALGSDQVSKANEAKIEELAQCIIAQNIRFVSITGHTDVTGSDEDNMLLGTRRSGQVLARLRTVIHRKKPWAQNTIFWQLDTKGEREPISNVAAENRRVEVCFPQDVCKTIGNPPKLF